MVICNINRVYDISNVIYKYVVWLVHILKHGNYVYSVRLLVRLLYTLGMYPYALSNNSREDSTHICSRSARICPY